ncbi:phosphatase PAP2 family protein [Parvibaculum sp.]|uniref:phosphatase PAP2 family protein n=1 Tax=Parvibaculum sp. TaxID=2024848 RepID=UPI00329A1723
MSDASLPFLRRKALRSPEVVLSLAALALFTFWPSIHVLDFRLETPFFDAAAGSWFFPPDDRGVLFWLLYRGPKIFLVVAGVSALLWLVWRGFMKRWRAVDTRFLLALLVLGLTPLFVGLLKNSTGVSCPVQETLFAGPYAHAAIWDRLFALVPSNEHLRCWPAGHAAAGFGLLGIRVLAPAGSRLSWAYLAPGLAGGWVLGLYQMARGQHYFSHTVVTMAIALILSAAACMILDRIEERG